MRHDDEDSRITGRQDRGNRRRVRGHACDRGRFARGRPLRHVRGGARRSRNTAVLAWINRVRQRCGDLADDCLKLYPAGFDEEATRSSHTAFRDEMAWHMRLYASLQSKGGNRAYWYFFTHEPPSAPAARNLKATHTVESRTCSTIWPTPRVYPDVSSPGLASASASERALAERVSSYWVNFARTSDPNGKACRAGQRSAARATRP